MKLLSRTVEVTSTSAICGQPNITSVNSTDRSKSERFATSVDAPAVTKFSLC
jgi:hypothetical protein